MPSATASLNTDNLYGGEKSERRMELHSSADAAQCHGLSVLLSSARRQPWPDASGTKADFASALFTR